MTTSRIPLPVFRKILFAGDFSDPSHEAFGVASSLARDEATQLVVVHVVQLVHLAEQPLIYGELGLPIPITTEYPTHYAALLERLKGFYVPDHPVEASYLLLEGDAADEILRTADKEGCDLIVMGTHGRSGLDRLLAGSVAESVMRRAKCPVLTVRTPTTHAETLTQQQSPATS